MIKHCGVVMITIIDISRGLLSAPVFPGDPEPRLQQITRMDMGDSCNLSALYFGLHTATHADAQRHFIESGAGIDQMPLASYIGECRVIEVTPGPITGDMVDRQFPVGCERLLLRTGGEAYLTESAAYELAARGLRLLGTDGLSIGGGADQAQAAVHRAILSAGTAVLEGLELSNAPAGTYFLFAPPVKLEGGDGAPVRAVLVSDYIFWSARS